MEEKGVMEITRGRGDVWTCPHSRVKSPMLKEGGTVKLSPLSGVSSSVTSALLITVSSADSLSLLFLLLPLFEPVEDVRGVIAPPVNATEVSGLSPGVGVGVETALSFRGVSREGPLVQGSEPSGAQDGSAAAVLDNPATSPDAAGAGAATVTSFDPTHSSMCGSFRFFFPSLGPATPNESACAAAVKLLEGFALFAGAAVTAVTVLA
jgi:hypothetical protein